ncbi:MAG TPA: serine/threonine-protein kinase [Verrucomicrobiota bacterium]|nr:serine/threonine-protein kinase [Verrucomicrobiota bacterium]
MSVAGERLGQYTLHELINSGGQSDIWLATDDANRSFAVRLLRNDSIFALGERKRFMAGCETLRACQDQKLIIGYVEHGKIGGQLALVMEYVEGENLKLLMNSGDPVLTDNIAQVLIDFATALEVVHDRGFMHLDVKPENVLLTRNGSLRLIDFDLAQPIPNPPRKLDRLSGTPAYMAPEQLQKLPVDQRADVFAYGVSAYELLTFRKPFPGENADEVLRRQLDRSEFVRPRELNSDIPAELEKIVNRCLEKDMEKRYPVTSVLVHDLRQALYVA